MVSLTRVEVCEKGTCYEDNILLSVFNTLTWVLKILKGMSVWLVEFGHKKIMYEIPELFWKHWQDTELNECHNETEWVSQCYVPLFCFLSKWCESKGILLL